MELLVDSKVGKPEFSRNNPRCTCNTIHHVFSLMNIEENLKIQIENISCTFEFGGRYGNICKKIHDKGFNGLYIIFDFEEFNLLQEYFLSKNKIPMDKIIFISEINNVKSVFTKDINNSLFIGMWSISETSLEYRNRFFNLLPDFDYYFIAYQSEFNEVDNTEYFSKLLKQKII